MNILNRFATPVTLVPAYGKNYASREKALEDWNAGRDFKIQNGPYCSKRDIDKLKSNASSVIIKIDWATVIVL